MQQIPLTPAPADDTRAAHALPAIMVNRFHVTAGPDLVRLTFGEQVMMEGENRYHQAVVIPKAEALGLAQAILGMYENMAAGMVAPDQRVPN